MAESTPEVGYNDKMRAEKLHRKLARQQAWVNQIAAQTEQRRREANDELEEIGLELINYEVVNVEELDDGELAELAKRALPED